VATLIFSSQTEQGLNDHWFLGNSLEVLEDWGMRMPYKIKESGQVWRLLLSLYLNMGFSQVIINVLAQLFSGFMLEAQMGSLRMAIFFFVVGISGNFLAATVDDKYATGAEPAMFGMLAGLIGMYLYYWPRMGDDWCRKVCGFFMMILLLVIGIFFLTSFAAPYKTYTKFYMISYPDSMGFFGGALFGFFLSWVFLPPTAGSLKQGTRREKGLFIAGLMISVIVLVLVTLTFCFGEAPVKYWSFDN
jgi:membrane associated rhomboid family serine protease